MAVLTIERDPCTCAGSAQAGSLERVRYFARQLLTVQDMVTDQDYFREKLRRHNRYLHGTGVVCGLEVKAAPIDDAKWRVEIGGGYAVGPYGDEIYVEEPVFFDLARCAAGDRTDPCDPTVYHRATAAIARVVFVAIKYAECFSKPVRAMAGGCGCEDAACEYSRIRDSFELGCIPRPPAIPRHSICNLRRTGAVTPCPRPPDQPWVVLAQVRLPFSTSTPITGINNNVRHRLFSTELIQEQLIDCCCDGPEPAPAQVTLVVPDNITLDASPPTVNATFNKDMVSASLTPSTFLVQEDANDLHITGAVQYHAATRTVVFTPANPLNPAKYRVTVRGTGSDPVVDTDGLVLDGDNDNTAGGDHVTYFNVSESIPVPH